jgi:hypothetical protein
VQFGIFGVRAAQVVITSVQCWSDTGDAVIQLRRSDGGDFVNGNAACNGTYYSSAYLTNGYQIIPVGYQVGMYEVSGTAKRINVVITYTTQY